ncbi:maleylpyruvate isomerase N-terminal domain-containing protein [Glycomyces buryatensis]|uniref:Maleylpyruvate isomerase family mycothiol-dependent enzyme n=1 Tax=Glycomyces buryatensis TaxID=2570927 RepID=A0A4S8QD63_9ACTN|nr:maleylpyruvate isomerase N-terminal domain-containing protein [Glycomyces buryatensis]THV42473.1 maleylpyruvate isomerase family mycothiol-dependent enzyme [Glycomyces buryatensis]
MTTEPAELLGVLRVATNRLVLAIGSMADSEVREPSLLPGWTRAHLITHVARNADALRNLLSWARTGVETPAYSRPGAREADIEAGADRSADDLHDDVAESAEAFAAEAEMVSVTAWQTEVRVMDGPMFRASLILPRRLTEVELHHTDLGMGYKAANWTPAFAKMDLPEPMRSWREERKTW